MLTIENHLSVFRKLWRFGARSPNLAAFLRSLSMSKYRLRFIPLSSVRKVLRREGQIWDEFKSGKKQYYSSLFTLIGSVLLTISLFSHCNTLQTLTRNLNAGWLAASTQRVKWSATLWSTTGEKERERKHWFKCTTSSSWSVPNVIGWRAYFNLHGPKQRWSSTVCLVDP